MQKIDSFKFIYWRIKGSLGLLWGGGEGAVDTARCSPSSVFLTIFVPEGPHLDANNRLYRDFRSLLVCVRDIPMTCLAGLLNSF